MWESKGKKTRQKLLKNKYQRSKNWNNNNFGLKLKAMIGNINCNML